QGFDQRIADADRRVAGAAPRAQRKPAENRDVLVPRQLAAALRARRRGPDDRLPQRQPVDAHVQEAADDGADSGGKRDAEGGGKCVDHHEGGGCDAGSVGSGLSGDALARRTWPFWSSYGAPAGSMGTPRRMRPRTSTAQSAGWP